jgi:hypothetical protein
MDSRCTSGPNSGFCIDETTAAQCAEGAYAETRCVDDESCIVDGLDASCQSPEPVDSGESDGDGGDEEGGGADGSDEENTGGSTGDTTGDPDEEPEEAEPVGSASPSNDKGGCASVSGTAGGIASLLGIALLARRRHNSEAALS